MAHLCMCVVRYERQGAARVAAVLEAWPGPKRVSLEAQGLLGRRRKWRRRWTHIRRQCLRCEHRVHPTIKKVLSLCRHSMLLGFQIVMNELDHCQSEWSCENLFSAVSKH